MKDTKTQMGIAQKKWSLIGLLPILTLGILYIVSDFLITDTLQRAKATVFLYIAIALTLLSSAAIYKSAGWGRLIAGIGFLIGILLIGWTYFVSSFSFTF